MLQTMQPPLMSSIALTFGRFVRHKSGVCTTDIIRPWNKDVGR